MLQEQVDFVQPSWNILVGGTIGGAISQSRRFMGRSWRTASPGLAYNART
jgi:hypothetical protein